MKINQRSVTYYFLGMLFMFTIGVLSSCSNTYNKQDHTSEYREVTITGTERGTVFKYAKIPRDI